MSILAIDGARVCGCTLLPLELIAEARSFKSTKKAAHSSGLCTKVEPVVASVAVCCCALAGAERARCLVIYVTILLAALAEKAAKSTPLCARIVLGEERAASTRQPLHKSIRMPNANTASR